MLVSNRPDTVAVRAHSIEIARSAAARQPDLFQAVSQQGLILQHHWV